jgi:rubrerythrin
MLNNREILGSELKDKIELYSELTGEDGWNVPVARVADFISGFEMGKEKFRKRGHWIYDDKCHEHGHCSECGYGSVDLVDGEPHHYCPNCGAKMKAGD